MNGKELKEFDYAEAAEIIGCEIEIIKAVTLIEAPNGGFDDKGRPIILYEPFVFGDLTKNKFDGATVIINNVIYPLSLNRNKIKWSIQVAKYGPQSVQYDKLDAAEKLDIDAAYKCCSWGRFQILGMNYKLCGYETLDNFLSDMFNSEKYHLLAFINFIKKRKLDKYLIEKNWIKFAESYNGKMQNKGTETIVDDYSYKLEMAYKKFKGEI